MMIVGEAPGSEEVRLGIPFVGNSGRLLDQMLHEAGILRTECYTTNVCAIQPPGNDIYAFLPTIKKDITPAMVQIRDRKGMPCIAEGLDRLGKEIALCKPEVIIAVGNTALWALTGKWGIKKWAGSRLACTQYPHTAVVIPIYHPAAILREYELRPMAVQDLRRAAAAQLSDQPPAYDFQVRPALADVVRVLDNLQAIVETAPLKLAVDIETRSGHIACIGIAWSSLCALCIPFMCVERQEGYWTENEETIIIGKLRRLLHHPNAQVIGQNFLYDVQYTFRWWRCTPNVVRDTMGAQHVLFAGMPKGLDYLSRMWCRWHVYWKDESKDWDPAVGEDQLWFYNCKDCIATFEIDTAQQAYVDKVGLRGPHDDHQAKFWLALDIMLKGMRRDETLRAEWALLLMEELSLREAYFERILGHPLNPQSPHQLKRLFYDDLKQPVIISRKTRAPTTDDEALKTIAKREPGLLPITRRIGEHRSLQVFLSTFVNAQPSWDGRIRTQFNPFGPETYRASSSQDAFGSGMNLQNVPSGKEEDGLTLPNIRKLFVPDSGLMIGDTDLDRADLQVVVWEAEDDGLKTMLRQGLDVHLYTARDIFGLKYPDSEIVEGTDSCAEHRARYKGYRQKAKAGVHATNYGVHGRTLAIALGVSVHEADRFISSWLGAHPGIRAWHNRTREHLTRRRYIENRFSYRRYYLGRTDDILPEALAWLPQSTVAQVINTLWKKISLNLSWVQVLLQVHDSLVHQFPPAREEETRRRISELARSIIVPYDDPLTIPVGTKTSKISWGDCK